MIPYIRSLTELMAITESRVNPGTLLTNNETHESMRHSAQIEKYLISSDKKEVNLPEMPKTLRRKWIKNQESISRFFDDLDYNNQIQSSYDLTLLERQNKKNLKDVA